VSVILLRHASAGDRDAWHGDDRLRPLDKRGEAQALSLRDLLLLRGVTRVVSSPSLRCMQTVAPLGLAIVSDERLAEGADVEETFALLHDLDDAVACTHGDVIEAVLGHGLKKGAGAVLDDYLHEVETITPTVRRLRPD
jgi:phosphohistidine phosphatase SixA